MGEVVGGSARFEGAVTVLVVEALGWVASGEVGRERLGGIVRGGALAAGVCEWAVWAAW